jgi:hypothetical protein
LIELQPRLICSECGLTGRSTRTPCGVRALRALLMQVAGYLYVRSHMTVTELIAVLGLVSGVTGTVLGVMNFLRDRARVEVALQWDMKSYGDQRYAEDKYWGIVTVTNIGRRPIYVSHVALRLPKGFDGSHLLINEGIRGKTLTEGSPAEMYVVTQENMEQYASVWDKIVAQVSDSSGRVWKSKRVRTKPSWAGG